MKIAYCLNLMLHFILTSQNIKYGYDAYHKNLMNGYKRDIKVTVRWKVIFFKSIKLPIITKSNLFGQMENLYIIL